MRCYVVSRLYALRATRSATFAERRLPRYAFYAVCLCRRHLRYDDVDFLSFDTAAAFSLRCLLLFRAVLMPLFMLFFRRLRHFSTPLFRHADAAADITPHLIAYAIIAFAAYLPHATFSCSILMPPLMSYYTIHVSNARCCRCADLRLLRLPPPLPLFRARPRQQNTITTEDTIRRYARH